MSGYILKNGIIATAGKKPHTGDVGFSGKFIVSPETAGRRIELDLKERSFVYPSLINTHDHLQGNYRPAVGPKKGSYYLTWQPWDRDLKASDTFSERSKISREELYTLSAYKCIFSGVTTVNDHFPQAINKKILPKLPIRAINEYGLAHELTSYDLKWGDGVEIEHERAIKNRWPFISHLAEGFDWEAMHSLENLEKQGILDGHCLFVHCISLSDDDIKKLKRAGASVSLCPSSNMLMFNVTAKIRKMLKAGVNLTLGTDSSASGPANLLEEMKNLRRLYQNMYGEDLDPKIIFEMVTVNAAKAFWMQDRIGALEEGKLGDVLVIKARKDDPFENLASASMKDIELLVLEGKPIYGELRFLDMLGSRRKSLPPESPMVSSSVLPRGYTEITVGSRPMFIIGDPAALYTEIRCRIGVRKVLDYLPFEPSGDCTVTGKESRPGTAGKETV
ncbi:MAG: amidohydrolase family protein [Treponema sp.]|nr:amidohydrolase family protein [Treponema sp.]